MAHKHHPALRSGLYSALSVLPGESAAAFKKLHQHLALEYRPEGVSEIDLVHDIARLTWRKRNLATYRLAYCARRFRHQVIERKVGALSFDPDLAGTIEAEVEQEEQARKDAEREVREKLGPDSELLELGEMITDKALREELDLIDRFDVMIGRKIKQLCQIKAMKEIARLTPSAGKVPQLQAPSALPPREPEIIAPQKRNGHAHGGVSPYR
jgi:hypothetical protein